VHNNNLSNNKNSNVKNYSTISSKPVVNESHLQGIQSFSSNIPVNSKSYLKISQKIA